MRHIEARARRMRAGMRRPRLSRAACFHDPARRALPQAKVSIRSVAVRSRLHLSSSLLLALLVALPARVLLSQATPSAELIASSEGDWPQFRGPRRDGICDERGLLQSWKE